MKPSMNSAAQALPVICNLFMALLLLAWSRYASSDICRYAIFTAYISLSWVFAYFRDPKVVVLVLLLPLLFLLPNIEASNPGQDIKHCSEIVSFSWTILLGVHCALVSGGLACVRYFLIAGIYGLCIESSGIRMGFFSEPGYMFYVPALKTPVVAVTGWITVFYPVMFIVQTLQMRWSTLSLRPTLCGILCGLIALAIDIHLDPIATNLNLWIWNEKLPLLFNGVPLLNFTSWFFAVAAFGSACFWIDRLIKDKLRRELILLVAIPGVQAMAGLLNFVSIRVIQGHDSIEIQIMRDYLGSL
ncbi:MAG: carotenoid biosynthesis protein [Spirochaetia bacterium]|nr:carotenoid biosynthesis protein [Spirochaetia bacterium]